MGLGHTTLHTWRSEGNLPEPVLSFHLVGWEIKLRLSDLAPEPSSHQPQTVSSHEHMVKVPGCLQSSAVQGTRRTAEPLSTILLLLNQFSEPVSVRGTTVAATSTV